MARFRVLVALQLILTMSIASSSLRLSTSQTNVPTEIVFHSTVKRTDPFNDVTMDVDFTDPAGDHHLVPAFWDGRNTWKVRYASPESGAHRYKSICTDTADKGLSGVTGEIEIVPYRGKNPLFRHGPVRVGPDKRHLVYADGKPFFWLGDTWWMGLAERLHWPDEFKALAADRVKKGFNVVQIVAGLYPDMFPFDPRGANEAGFPWEAEYARINPAYFDRADERIGYLVESGVAPCIVGAWGYFMPWMGVKKMEQHWRYLIARYGAMPVVWCGAGEANLPWYLAKGFPYDDRDQVHEWSEVLSYIRRTDPFHRLLTIHPTAIDSYSSRHATDDPGLLDFDMLQTPHGELGAAEAALNQMHESYTANPKMPVIDGEAAYEMLGDSLPTRWTRAMFWICMMNGAAGHTYGANGIWQNNRPGDPHGNSPHGANYGKISSQEAMHLPGSAQVALGKRLFQRYDWQRFEPHPEWATYVRGDEATLDGSQWIWYPEGNPLADAPIGMCYFRLDFELPVGRAVKGARLVFSADGAASVYLNGSAVGESKDWRLGASVGGLAHVLRSGANVLAVRAENIAANVRANPAGLIAVLEIRFDDGDVRVLRSDATWRAARVGPHGWKELDFDDRAWPSALSLGPYGVSPWGKVGEASLAIGPQSIGIPGGARLIYTLQPATIVVRRMELTTKYRARLFDPVTGRLRNLGTVVADSAGEWICASPPGWDHDWVLVLEPTG